MVVDIQTLLSVRRYVNFLICNGGIVAPALGVPESDERYVPMLATEAHLQDDARRCRLDVL